MNQGDPNRPNPDALLKTHGRSDTLALCEGLEQLPAKEVEYAGKQFRDFDVDAVLQRKPDVLLLDELAHRNIPGTRPPRRYQDIEALLDQGTSF